MKKFFSKYYLPIIAASLLVVAFYVLIICLEEKKAEVYISVVAAILVLYFGLLKHQISNDEMFLKVFSDFNSRYTNDFSNFLNELRTNVNRELTQKEVNLIIDYFNLCAEEYLWFKKGRLPKDVWNAWRTGILENLNIKQVHQIYLAEMETDNERKAYYGLEDEIQELAEKNVRINLGPV